MAKVLKSIRVETDTDTRIQAIQESTESLSAAYNRVLIAGLKYLDDKTSDSKAQLNANSQTSVTNDYIQTLKNQLEQKDEQIKILQQIAMQSQTLQLANTKPRKFFRRSKSANLE